MLVGIEVGVALQRPPREDACIYYVIEIPLRDDLNLIDAMNRACLEAEELAGVWSASDRRVVMPVRITTVEIYEV